MVIDNYWSVFQSRVIIGLLARCRFVGRNPTALKRSQIKWFSFPELRSFDWRLEHTLIEKLGVRSGVSSTCAWLSWRERRLTFCLAFALATCVVCLRCNVYKLPSGTKLIPEWLSFRYHIYANSLYKFYWGVESDGRTFDYTDSPYLIR